MSFSLDKRKDIHAQSLQYLLPFGIAAYFCLVFCNYYFCAGLSRFPHQGGLPCIFLLWRYTVTASCNIQMHITEGRHRLYNYVLSGCRQICKVSSSNSIGPHSNSQGLLPRYCYTTLWRSIWVRLSLNLQTSTSTLRHMWTDSIHDIKLALCNTRLVLCMKWISILLNCKSWYAILY